MITPGQARATSSVGKHFAERLAALQPVRTAEGVDYNLIDRLQQEGGAALSRDDMTALILDATGRPEAGQLSLSERMAAALDQLSSGQGAPILLPVTDRVLDKGGAPIPREYGWSLFNGDKLDERLKTLHADDGSGLMFLPVPLGQGGGRGGSLVHVVEQSPGGSFFHDILPAADARRIYAAATGSQRFRAGEPESGALLWQNFEEAIHEGGFGGGRDSVQLATGPMIRTLHQGATAPAQSAPAAAVNPVYEVDNSQQLRALASAGKLSLSPDHPLYAAIQAGDNQFTLLGPGNSGRKPLQRSMQVVGYDPAAFDGTQAVVVEIAPVGEVVRSAPFVANAKPEVRAAAERVFAEEPEQLPAIDDASANQPAGTMSREEFYAKFPDRRPGARSSGQAATESVQPTATPDAPQPAQQSTKRSTPRPAKEAAGAPAAAPVEQVITEAAEQVREAATPAERSAVFQGLRGSLSEQEPNKNWQFAKQYGLPALTGLLGVAAGGALLGGADRGSRGEDAGAGYVATGR